MADANAHRGTPDESDKEIAFGTFRLIPERQQLFEGDRRVRLGSRALDILIALVERPGDLVTKNELLDRVWPGIFVEEANLRVHISALRKTLGDGLDGKQYLANVPGRGYRFVAPVTLSKWPVAPRAPQTGALGNLPALLVRVIGRDDLLKHLAAGLDRERLVSIVGAWRYRQDHGCAVGRSGVERALPQRHLLCRPRAARRSGIGTERSRCGARLSRSHPRCGPHACRQP